jgi:radical SAM protein with 4Fe4S-binding SPASM domain
MSQGVLDLARQHSVNAWQPLQASLELTHRCNERCRHCYISEFKDDDDRILSLDQWVKVLEELRAAGTLYIVLMGGEPMLSPHFHGVSREANAMGFHVSMISNGLLIKSKEDAQRLKDNGLHTATFSLYSLDRDVHDRLTRVRGSQEKTVAALEWCREVGIDTHVNCLLTNENIYGIFELQDWCLERVIELKVDPMVTAKLNGNLDPVKLRLTDEQLFWFYWTSAKRYRKSLPKPAEIQPNGYVCNAAKGKCAVTPYGDLLPCIEIRESLGNLVEQSFSDVWQNPEVDQWRKLTNQDINGADLSFCDHCPGMAKNELGDPNQVLSYAKKVGEVKSRVRREFLENERTKEYGLPAT